MTVASPLRRRLLVAAVALPVVESVFGQSKPLTCGELTPRQTEGPFFKTDSPKRTSLLERDPGKEKVVLTGVVMSAQCRPVANALLDFWHADERGAYDNDGYRYRGHQFSDAQGRYRLETIVPSLYPGRARHIHVKVQAPGRRILTTQLYFAGDAGNRSDGLYRRELEMRSGVFDFVVDA
jgi:protocatechuate 3,4-dioxygenase beta subunit